MSESGRSLQDVCQSSDRRTARTRESIDAAFLALLKRKGYEAVAVSEVVREANIGRATFYEHYASKDDLLRAQLRRVVRATVRAVPSSADIDASGLFAHIRDVPILYRLVAGRAGTARSVRLLQEVLEERVLAMYADRAASVSFAAPWTASVAARVAVAGLCALLSWWVDTGMAATVAEMQSMFGTCSTAPCAPKTRG